MQQYYLLVIQESETTHLQDIRGGIIIAVRRLAWLAWNQTAIPFLDYTITRPVQKNPTAEAFVGSWVLHPIHGLLDLRFELLPPAARQCARGS